jgi:hypothetical protein
VSGSLSERNGLRSSLLRVRRERRNSNIDLCGTERSTDWGKRERVIIKPALFFDLPLAETIIVCGSKGG